MNTRVLVLSDERWLSPSRSHVARGKLHIELVNMGEDDHDLRVSGAGGGWRGGTDVVGPGEQAELTIPVKYDTYKL